MKKQDSLIPEMASFWCYLMSHEKKLSPLVTIVKKVLKKLSISIASQPHIGAFCALISH